jgi:hypothetical protein
MSSFAPVQPHRAPPDPSKHVNYAFGMLLGQDDFDQEFAYLSGRDKWLVRDLIGYGVVSGLGLSVEEEAEKGPRVMVQPGVAVTPSGQLVCVSPAQCAYLNDWLLANRDEVEEDLDSSPLSPPEPSISLAVVACYAECPTDDVPLPGEPCRSEDDLTAPSRRQDHFRLELRRRPPEQTEEAAVRDVADWLRQVPFVEGPGSDLATLLEELRAAARTDEPLSSPPDFLHGSPPAGLAIPRARVCEYLQAVAGLWATELRGRWRQPMPACGPTLGPAATAPDADCLLLGELLVPLTVDPVTGALLVSGAADVQLDLGARATLLHLRLLQEWLLCGPTSAGASGVVASARVDAAGNTGPAPLFAHNLLGVTSLGQGLYHLAVAGFDPVASYLVSGAALSSLANSTPHSFEVVPDDDPDLQPLLANVPGPGVTVRVRRVDGNPPDRGFMVEISQAGGGQP